MRKMTINRHFARFWTVLEMLTFSSGRYFFSADFRQNGNSVHEKSEHFLDTTNAQKSR